MTCSMIYGYLVVKIYKAGKSTWNLIWNTEVFESV